MAQATKTANKTATLPTAKVAIVPMVTVPAQTAIVPSVPSLPTTQALSAAKTSQQQATLCHAAWGNTNPLPSLVLAIGSGTAHGKAGGQRNQHQTALLQAINAVLQAGNVATLANVAAWVKTNAAKLPAPHGAACAVPANVRCALAQGTVRATGWGQ